MCPFEQQTSAKSATEEMVGMKSDVKRLRIVNLKFHLGKSQDETEGAREDRERGGILEKVD